MNQLADRINSLSPDKVDLLMKKLKPGKNGSVAATSNGKAVNKKRPFRPLEDKNYSLQIAKPGLFDTMDLKTCPRRSPGSGEVEIEVHAAGINFRDVMVALGSYPTPPGAQMPAMGVDCAGTIVRVGADVTSAKVGDAVMCMSAGTFSQYVITHHACVMPKPENFTFEQAAAIPCVFATVQFAMIDVGHLRKGESVLIHSAAGGVGLAAIQVARAIGAEIFATVGTPEKRELMSSMGIQHVFDSRSTSFADDILKVTHGKGVDVVLNSLAGDAIQRGFDILRPLGRFLELGKRDLAANKPLGMFPFIRGASFTGIDLALLNPYINPDVSSTLYGTLGKLFRDGVYQPLPVRTYPISDAATAFGYMMQGKHIGKLVLTMPEKGVLVTPSAE